jgi:hypothetical protein
MRSVARASAWLVVVAAAACATFAAGAACMACDAIIGLEEPTVLDAGQEAGGGTFDSAPPDGGGPSTDAPRAPVDSASFGDSALQGDTGPTMQVEGGCTAPPALRSNLPGTIPCQLGADGGPLTCGVGSQCCDGAMISPGVYAANDCEMRGAPCQNGGAGGLTIECNQAADCAINGVDGGACCLVGANPPMFIAACNYYKSTGGQRVQCESNPGGGCGGMEIQVCESDADCLPGKTCTAMDWKIFQFGFCSM